jgi:outer membrane receptor protein involved in Fe transport
MKKSLLVIIFLNLLSFQILASTTGKLSGVVTDAATNEPLPFVNIILDGTNIGAAADIDGKYVILNISPGKYNVRFQSIGYQTKVINNVSISIDLTTSLNVTLSETSVKLDEVVVQADSRGIQKDVTSSQALISSDEIETLPVAEFDDLMQLQAGVSRGANGEFHIRGGRSEEISFKVNGVSITDGYDNSRGLDIDNTTIQELQVISGTFNAEHGQAMSGIINSVIKEGSSSYDGLIRIYGADYVSNSTDIFPNVDNYNPFYNIQGNFGGPIPGTSKKLTFFLSGRYIYDDGWLYGTREFTPTGSAGDGAAVSMNWSKRIMSIANLSYFASKSIKLNLQTLYSNSNYKDYSHDFKLNPDGDVEKFSRSLSTTLTLTHTVSSKTFYTVKASHFFRDFNEYLYEDPYDSRYLSPDSLNTVQYAFKNSGTNLHRFFRETNTFLVKFDFTSQVHENHMLQFGLDGSLSKLKFDDYTLEPLTVNNISVEPFQPSIPGIDSPNREVYGYDNSDPNLSIPKAEPIQASGYLQDKIEYEDVIINVGVRFDYFDSRGRVLVDETDPNIYTPLRDELKDLTVQEREPYFYKDAKPKWLVVPRLGIAYPISVSGVAHFSFGQFLQVPVFSQLFNRASYKVPTTGTPGSVYGNPDLEPQTTTTYEIGFRQEFADVFLTDVTLFYRDIRNYVTAGPTLETRNGVPYSIYTNRDYANVKGITFVLKKQFSNSFSFDINYTFQFAEGISSTPEDDFFAARSNSEPTYYLLPLDWDQRHILNSSFYVGGNTWGTSIIGRYGTGLPYTPSVTQATANRGITSGFSKNTSRKPNKFSLDLRLHKSFKLFDSNIIFFVRVFNLLDSKVVTDVFADSGQPDYTTEAASLRANEAAGITDPQRPNTIDEYLTRPWYYEAPRRIQLGFDFEF